MELTIKEAFEQGYTMFGYESKEWQSACDLHDDIFKEAEEYGEDIPDMRLFDKEAKYPKISPQEIAEILSDRIGEDDSEQCARNDDSVYNTVRKIDFTEVAENINKELEQHKYYMLTKIGLKHNL